MINKKAVEAYKNELKNLEYYREKEKTIQNEIELMEYEMGGVKGVEYSKEGGGAFNKSAYEHHRLIMIEKYNLLIEKRKEVQNKQKSIYRVLNEMEKNDKKLVVDVIAKKRKYREVCKELNISNTSILFAKINEIIDEAQKKAG